MPKPAAQLYLTLEPADQARAAAEAERAAVARDRRDFERRCDELAAARAADRAGRDQADAENAARRVSYGMRAAERWWARRGGR